MATAYARRMFNGGAITSTVPLQIGASDSSFTLSTATNWPDGSTGNFTVVVDQATPEKILCSSRSGLVVTVASSGRGYDGTSAVQHSAGSSIQCVHIAQDDDEANQVVNQVLGQPSAAKGDILAMLSAAGPNTLTRIGIGSAGQILQVGASALPQWSSTLLQPSSSALGSGTTTSGSYANLSSTSATVTITTGTKVLVVLSGILLNSTTGDNVNLSVAVSGASTIAASDSFGLAFQPAAGNQLVQASAVIPFGSGGGAPVALTAGSNIFTAQAHITTGGTGTLASVLLTVIPLN